jgi:hypothetical protein
MTLCRCFSDPVDAGKRCRYSPRQPVRYIVPMMRLLTLVGVLAVSTFAVTGCGSDSASTSPSPSPAPAPTPAPTPTPAPAPTPTPTPTPAPTTASLTGSVSNSGGQRLAGATVRVIDGPNTGQSVQANGNGYYRFDSLAIANMNFAATATGYLEVRAGTFVNGTNTLAFVLSPIPAPAPSITITSRIIAGGPGTLQQEWGFSAVSTVALTSYDWDFGDGASSLGGQADEQHVYRTKGTLTVTVTGRRASGGPVVGTLMIEVQ